MKRSTASANRKCAECGKSAGDAPYQLPRIIRTGDGYVNLLACSKSCDREWHKENMKKENRDG